MNDFNPLEATFVPWPKMPRLNRGIVITEKIDGTNAAIGVLDDGTVYAQSRKRIITPGDDNFGFATWVAEHAEDFAEFLGPGLHFGEWWGRGIQRGYGVDRKYFSLFNTSRWGKFLDPDSELIIDPLWLAGVRTVPVLYEGPFSETEIHGALEWLADYGSRAVRGFMNPEGIVIYHTAANHCFKVTIHGDDAPKSQVQ